MDHDLSEVAPQIALEKPSNFVRQKLLAVIGSRIEHERPAGKLAEQIARVFRSHNMVASEQRARPGGRREEREVLIAASLNASKLQLCASRDDGVAVGSGRDGTAARHQRDEDLRLEEPPQELGLARRLGRGPDQAAFKLVFGLKHGTLLAGGA